MLQVACERDRQAAILYLQAAATTDEETQRSSLRRRAAELILPRWDKPRDASIEGRRRREPRRLPMAS